MNGPVYLHYDLSVLGQNNVLQRVLHQQGEIHLIHGHVRQRGLLQRDEDIGDEINVINGRKKNVMEHVFACLRPAKYGHAAVLQYTWDLL